MVSKFVFLEIKALRFTYLYVPSYLLQEYLDNFTDIEAKLTNFVDLFILPKVITYVGYNDSLKAVRYN